MCLKGSGTFTKGSCMIRDHELDVGTPCTSHKPGHFSGWGTTGPGGKNLSLHISDSPSVPYASTVSSSNPQGGSLHVKKSE